ncbi:hypothetical protein ACFVZD_45695 [Streptomyces sp. NPDC058287]|uniref:hypothetical protein n=1 Tax=unclassified Streptomyces TaxID=2593676 RepID=UPI0036EDD521
MRFVAGNHQLLILAQRVAPVRLRETTAPQAREALTVDTSLVLASPNEAVCRCCGDQLDAEGIEADELTVHTPDLDDVFFALTGDAKAPESHNNQTKENVR